ncbi:hypothetical protein GQ600_27412 [Phytophthora cactorum]|nr:hypothetical protein GQ600_27412 [Phytophthora cactorum]
MLPTTTIFENTAAGEKEITRDHVVAAAKLANARKFIMSLSKQHGTMIEAACCYRSRHSTRDGGPRTE